MKETEIKFRIDDAIQTEEKLQSSDFVFLRTEHQRDVMLMVAAQTPATSWLRLRYLPDAQKSIITIKIKPATTKNLGTIRDEFEIQSDTHPDVIVEFFRNLGYSVMGTIEKTRKYYTKPPFTVVIDDVKNLGLFIELETLAKGTDAISSLHHIASSLNLSREVKEGYFDLMNMRARNVFFEILRRVGAKRIEISIPPEVSIENGFECTLKITENGSYYIGFSLPFEIFTFPGKTVIKVVT